MNRYVRAFLIALVVAGLFFGKQIANFSSEANRYFWSWDALDAGVFVGLVIAFALLGTGIYALLVLTGNKTALKIGGQAFVVIAILAVLSNFRTYTWPTAPAIGLWIVMIAGVVLGSRKWPLTQWVGKACLVFSILPIILIFQVLSWRHWGAPIQLPAPAAARDNASPIFFFSFDTIGWPRISDDGKEFGEAFPRLRELSQQSYLFANGVSPDRVTRYSLPKMVYQRNDKFSFPESAEAGQKTSWEIDDKNVPSQQVASSLQIARDHGYQSYLLAYYLPLLQILGPQPNWASIYTYEPRGRTLWERLQYTLIRNVHYIPYPGTRQVWDFLYAKTKSEYWVQIQRNMEQEALGLIDRCPNNSFVFVHFPLAHPPFVFNADGSYKGHTIEMAPKTDDGYMDHLRFVDKTVGGLIDRLKADGKFDNAMIVFTSDHGWTPNFAADLIEHPGRIQRVPLLIKMPHQQKPIRPQERVKNSSLRPLFEMLMQNQYTPEKFSELVQSVAITELGPAQGVGRFRGR